jgi:hypothetical protein
MASSVRFARSSIANPTKARFRGRTRPIRRKSSRAPDCSGSSSPRRSRRVEPAAFKASRRIEEIYEPIVESSLLIFNVPGTDVTQGESCHDVIVFVERHHGIIVLDRPGDLWNPAFSSIIKDQDKRWHRVPMKSARISRR